jgi:hypothetical protein
MNQEEKVMKTENYFAHVPLILGVVFSMLAFSEVRAQYQCTLNLSTVNHNRYVYETDEECTIGLHTVPWGNWGVNSNLGRVQDRDQFKGWRQPCNEVRVEWNSCSVNYAHQNCERFNFPNWEGTYPNPANGYPYSDSYGWNDSVPYGATCVDQFSPCGFNQYGSARISYQVSPPRDFNCDGTFDSGGCLDLNGFSFTVRNNFMTVYELDYPDSDDLVQTMFFPDLSVTMNCDAYGCYAVGDNNYDGWIDDVNDQFSSAYMWPTLYQDDWGAICYPSDPGVPCKRIDATVRIGRFSGSLNQAPCDPVCNPYCLQ